MLKLLWKVYLIILIVISKSRVSSFYLASSTNTYSNVVKFKKCQCHTLVPAQTKMQLRSELPFKVHQKRQDCVIWRIKRNILILVCWNGLQNDRNCPPGLHFSYIDNECVDPFLADCDLDFHLCKGSRQTGLPTFHKNTRNCESYFLCVGSEVITLRCEPGSHFDERQNWCTDPETAQCEVSDKSTKKIWCLWDF